MVSKEKLEKKYEKNSILITIISCIVLLLVLCYFGINSGVKVTYSASEDTCDSGYTLVPGKNFCCPTGYIYNSTSNNCYKTYETDSESAVCTSFGGTMRFVTVNYICECPIKTVTSTTPEYTITFYANGGKTSNGSTEFTVECQANSAGICVKTDDEIEDVSRSGYDFKGWSSTENCPSNAGTTDSLRFSANGAMWACWKAFVTYAINYDANEGSGAPDSETKTKGTSVKLSTVEPTRDGFNFIKWTTEKDGSGDSYKPGDPYTDDKSVTLFAQWEDEDEKQPTTPTPTPDPDDKEDDDEKESTSSEKTFTATFDPNGGELEGSNTATCTGETKCPVNVPASNNVGRDGYLFDGWGTTTACKNGYTETVSLTKEKTTFYACWKSNSISNTDSDNNVPDNPTTGKTTLMAFIWFFGLMAIGYAFYYFKSIREN